MYSETREILVQDMSMTVFESPEMISDVIVKDNRFWEQHVFEKWIEYFPKNGLMLDIGANIGNHCLMFKKFLPELKIWAFEMSYNNFRLLYKNIYPYSDIKCFNVALSNSVQMISYKDSEDNNNGGISVHNVEDGRHKNISIPLDSLTIPEPIVFIKIDIESHEKYAYEGMRNFLLRDKPLIWAEDWVQSGHVQGESSIQYLLDMGYEIVENIIGDYLLKHKDN
jgi:FkbM family methyltransferase